jgi:hypothetical protein
MVTKPQWIVSFRLLKVLLICLPRDAVVRPLVVVVVVIVLVGRPVDEPRFRAVNASWPISVSLALDFDAGSEGIAGGDGNRRGGHGSSWDLGSWENENELSSGFRKKERIKKYKEIIEK